VNLLSTTLWSGIATALRLGSGLVVAKMVAMAGGPAALAVFGQFQNFLVLIVGVSGALFQSGLVKYAAEHRENKDELAGMLATAIKLSAIVALVGSVLLLLFHNEIANLVLHQSGWASLFLVTGIVLPLLVTNGIALALLNGMGQIRHYLLLNALTALINMLAVVILSLWNGVEGALYGLLVGPILAGLVSVGYAVRIHGRVLSVARHGTIDSAWVKRLGQFAIMALTSLLTSALLPMGIRDQLVSQIGWQAAGYWQAVWQVSGAYLGIVTAGFSVYYLPKLSQLTRDEDIRQEMLAFYRTAMPIVLLTGGMVYLLREVLLLLLYSDKFLPAAPLFAWQIAGDMLKISSWVLSYMLVAKKMTAWFIGSELTFVGLMYLANLILIPMIGIQTPVVVYASMYAAYAVFMYLLVGRRYLGRRRT
jgi:O-antigen/teichoic acid export membrane protein